MTRLRMAVIGTGALGQHHARILAEDPSVELVAVADTDPSRGRNVASRVGTRFVDDHCQLLDQVAAAVIAVPTAAHVTVAGDFIERRIPVLVEKPLAADLRDAERLVQIAEQTGTLLQVGHVERFNPATRTAASLCGSPRFIRAERLSPFSFRSIDIGVIHDLMIHDLDLLLDLVRAPVVHVESFGICILGKNEDVVQARLTFENGCIADLTASRVSPVVHRKMQIWSRLGCVDVDFQSRRVLHFRPSDELMYGTSPVARALQPGADIEQLKRDVFGRFITVATPPVPDDDPLSAELRHFVDCVKEGRRPLVDGRVALRALVVANRILQGVERHNWDGHADGAVGPSISTPPPRRLAG